MILGQIAYVDCLVFLIFLIPQLLLRVNVLELLEVALQALPFLCAWHNITARGRYGWQTTDKLSSLTIALPVPQRALDCAKDRQITFRTASDSIRGSCHQNRSLCLRESASQYR